MNVSCENKTQQWCASAHELNFSCLNVTIGHVTPQKPEEICFLFKLNQLLPSKLFTSQCSNAVYSYTSIYYI